MSDKEGEMLDIVTLWNNTTWEVYIGLQIVTQLALHFVLLCIYIAYKLV